MTSVLMWYMYMLGLRSQGRVYIWSYLPTTSCFSYREKVHGRQCLSRQRMLRTIDLKVLAMQCKHVTDNHIWLTLCKLVLCFLDLGTKNDDLALLLKLRHAASDLVTFGPNDTSQYIKFTFNASCIFFVTFNNGVFGLNDCLFTLFCLGNGRK